MKTKIKAVDGRQLAYEAPFNRFVHDFLGFAIGKLGANIEPPSACVFLVPDSGWWNMLGHLIELQGFPYWKEARAAVVYVPSTLEDRIMLADEIERTKSGGEYDRFVDYNSFIWVRRPELFSDGVEAATEIYYSMAACCIRLVTFAAAGSGGVGVISGYEEPAVGMMNNFCSTMTPSEFAARYVPEAA